MIKIIPIERYEGIITRAWESDADLLEKFHYCAGEGLERCVEDTLSKLEKCKDLQFFKIEYNDKEFGFFATEYFKFGSFLTTFFIFPKFRSKNNGKNFISLIRKHCDPGKYLFTAVFENNERAAKFLENNGFEVIEYGTDGHRKYYIYKYAK